MFKFKGSVSEWRGHQAMQAKLVESAMGHEVDRFLKLQRYAIKRDKTWAKNEKIWDKIRVR